MLRNTLGLFFVLLLAGNSFAEGLMSKEATSHYNEGVKSQKASDFASANAFYQKTLALDPTDSKWQKFILNNRGAIAAQEGRMEDAEELFKKSLQIDPNYLPPKLNLGFIYEQRRTELESIKYWLKVLNINLDEVKPKGFVLGEIEETKTGNK